jgi:transposase InsO family protein
MGHLENGTQRLQAERINHVWSCDFVFDRAEWGDRLKWLPVIGEFTRECLSLEVERSMTSSDVIRTLDRRVKECGIPDFIRSDNGPEFVARAVKDWIAARGFRTLFIEPGSPWQNNFIESFHATFRDEFRDVESFTSLLEARVISAEHRDRYNHRRPHSPLGDRTAAEFAAACLNPPTLGLAKCGPIPDPEAGKSDQPEPEESTHHEKLS